MLGLDTRDDVSMPLSITFLNPRSVEAVLGCPRVCCSTAQHTPVYGPTGQSDSISYTWLPDPAMGQVYLSYKKLRAKRVSRIDSP